MQGSKNLPKCRDFLAKALAEQQASAIAFLFERKGQTTEFYLGSHSHPGLDSIARATAADSLFDLASVTKILSTLNLLFIAESEGKLAWNDPLQKYFASFPSPSTTILDLLTHRSGLPSHLEFFRRYEKGDAKMGDQKILFSWICEAGFPNPGQQVYSDLGFMMLGFLLESLYGKPLTEIFHEKIVSKLKLENTGFVTLTHAPAPSRMYGFLAEKARFVATETCPWRKKTLQGEVHDDNTWAMGGYAGHAGLFSNLQDTKTLFRHLWKQAKANPAFLARKAEAPGVFSYGMITYPGLRPYPGPAFEGALGHTGFVGTSAWFHEPSETTVILLANRVHPLRTDQRWIQTRLDFHKLLWEETGL